MSEIQPEPAASQQSRPPDLSLTSNAVEAGFVAELQAQTLKPPRGDAYISKFAAASLGLYARRPDYRQLVAAACRGRDCSPSYRANLFLKYTQYRLSSDPSYPYEDTAQWTDAISTIATGETAQEDFLHDVTTHQVQSNVSDRYKALRFCVDSYKQRFSGQPRVLDIGCSLNHGLKRLAGVREFGPIDLHDAADELYEPYLNALTQQFPLSALKYGLGMDIQQPTIATSQRIASDSFYPGELTNRTNLETFHTLDEAAPDSVDFRVGDIQQADDNVISDQQFDIAFFSTMLYQHRPTTQKAILAGARRQVRPDGLLVVQDFAHPNPDNPQSINFRSNWFDAAYPYQTMVYDLTKPDAGFQTLYAWTDGRLSALRMSRLAIKLLAEAM